MAFKRIMERAGIDDGVARERSGQRGHKVSRLSFHSLRHSFTSALANANVPAEVRQKLTGHADERSHGFIRIANLKCSRRRSRRSHGCQRKAGHSEQTLEARAALGG
jgi:integrase